MTSITDLFSNPFGKLQSLVNSITENANFRYPAIFVLTAGAVFVGSFLLILLLSGLTLGLIYGVGTFISHFFSGFILSAFTQGSLAFLGGLSSGLNFTLLIFPALFWGITNLSLLSGAIVTAWTAWKDPGMVSNNGALNYGDPQYQKAALQAPLQPVPAPALAQNIPAPGVNPYIDPNLLPPLIPVDQPTQAAAAPANALPIPLPVNPDLLVPPVPPGQPQPN